MSQTQMRPQARRPGVSGTAPKPADLVATVQHLVFEPGLYTMHISASRSSATDLGVKLPCVRLEAVPPTAARPGRANVVNTRESGWLSPSEDPSFVLVVGGQAGAILTIYRANDGMPAPEIRLRHVFTGAGNRLDQEGLAPNAAPRDQAAAAVRLAALAHVSSLGDMTDGNGNWVGRVGSGSPIEGFALTPPGDFPPDGIEYQAILGNNWNTPWFRGGEFCGSRGLMLPLLGYRVQLKGPAASEFECRYWGQFLGGKAIGPITDGEACASADTPLEALRVVITRKTHTASVASATPSHSPVVAPGTKGARKDKLAATKLAESMRAPEKPQPVKSASARSTETPRSTSGATRGTSKSDTPSDVPQKKAPRGKPRPVR